MYMVEGPIKANSKGSRIFTFVKIKGLGKKPTMPVGRN